ncbi:MAG: peptidoglycan DD-metalloendopeptidase family protein [Nanoarchaeota archaeon]|nr:peptidoglycan DD-metalloendopeptidase family protein [Nanoarchaeota archaeon]
MESINFQQKNFSEILPKLRENSELIILDFNQIPPETPDYANIKLFFEKSIKEGINPRLPENRQAFNNLLLQKSGKKYLIGRYLENRKEILKGSNIEKEGRTIHLGIDIFSKNLETIYSPLDGEIVRTGKEYGVYSYGNYVIMKHNLNGQIFYIFYGHLSDNLPKLGKIFEGDKIAVFGDFPDENGGWSRHVHFQILTELPKEETPIGYTSQENLEKNKIRFPNPNLILNYSNII